MKPLGSINGAWILALVLGFTGASCATQVGNRPLGDTETRRHGDTETAAALQLPPVPDPRPLPTKEADAATKVRVQEAYGKLPLHFEANQGQTGEQVKFLSRGSGYTLFLTPTEAVLALRQPEPKAKGKREEQEKTDLAKLEAQNSQLETVLRTHLVGANPNHQVAGLDELPGKSNYFIGNDPKKWRTNIPTYAKVGYRNIYPGIDLVYYGNQSRLEYDFVVAPGADPKAIRLAFEGTDKVRVDSRGDLILGAAGGEVRLRKPYIYQDVNGSRRPLAGGYVLSRFPEVAFHVSGYDASRPLVIDPVLEFATYLGGTGAETGLGIGLDGSGNTYVTGDTSDGAMFPGPQGFSAKLNPAAGATDGFVVKLDPSGKLMYSTYFGGGKNDTPTAIAVGPSGTAHVVGYTNSADFPTTPDAFDKEFNRLGTSSSSCTPGAFWGRFF